MVGSVLSSGSPQDCPDQVRLGQVAELPTLEGAWSRAGLATRAADPDHADVICSTPTGRNMFEKRHYKYSLSIEKGTPNVEDDDQYHVIVNGKEVLATRVFELAKIIYEEQREELRIATGDPDPREILRRETAGREARAIRSESIARTRNHGGGPGGRGGVG